MGTLSCNVSRKSLAFSSLSFLSARADIFTTILDNRYERIASPRKSSHFHIPSALNYLCTMDIYVLVPQVRTLYLNHPTPLLFPSFISSKIDRYNESGPSHPCKMQLIVTHLRASITTEDVPPVIFCILPLGALMV